MRNPIAFLLLTVLCLGGVGLAERATHTPVYAIGAACGGEPPEQVWVKGNVLHWRGKTAFHPVLSDNPLVAGQDVWVFDIDLNMTSGVGSFHGDVSIEPDAVAGTWEGKVGGHFFGFEIFGHFSGRGTGELAGKKLRFELHANLNPADVIGLPVDVCGGDVQPSAAFIASGVILDPGN